MAVSYPHQGRPPLAEKGTAHPARGDLLIGVAAGPTGVFLGFGCRPPSCWLHLSKADRNILCQPTFLCPPLPIGAAGWSRPSSSVPIHLERALPLVPLMPCILRRVRRFKPFLAIGSLLCILTGRHLFAVGCAGSGLYASAF